MVPYIVCKIVESIVKIIKLQLFVSWILLSPSGKGGGGGKRTENLLAPLVEPASSFQLNFII
jgi:hypothetical protein